ncbi:glycosyltransferase, partial [Polynucleobacter sp. 35-46-11]|uniref:glycosyltransferase family 2 protein n=1 Tax=Polynucleobacter sp. 35-46-11 TaxID=1970425 RepID=UPI0025D65113
GLKSIIDNIKISILMPVYKVKPELLISAIESVRRQSYLNWELCIVDDGSDDVTIKKILENYSENDNRIKIQLNKTNHGISSATNDALDLATGEFVGLLDNDDILTFDALEEVFAAIKNNPSTDYIYSDECKIDDNGLPIEIFSKPDWSPSALINCMYTGHFSIYRKKLIYDIGKFRSKYDFSQDYDLALRASSQANNIIHISKVLYGWRMTEGSGAQGDKPYARISNIAALQDFADNKRILAKAEPEPYGNHLRILKSQNHEKVSIIIPSDNFTNISNTIDTIIENTLYENYEIIIVTNSKIAAKLQPIKSYDQIRIAKYDLPFNFSDKCNYGAKMATGEIIVFFNDDVRVVSKDWLEIIIEAFITTGAGIVGPKLLYENYLIQHAGMVTGVRGLVGTAFHCLPHETQA